jgi:hypothetical protein
MYGVTSLLSESIKAIGGFGHFLPVAQHIMGTHDTFQELELHIHIVGYFRVVISLLVVVESIIVFPDESTRVAFLHQLLGGVRCVMSL